ncbi:ADP-ribosylation factor-like protein 6-interacting protein 6 [Ptychodera flava]|uniref:ADP-ribosylation factor-like protein 6-interacting protein 6 n=1 Tax=Ptychodera flava TaxID=63121 RepID=UPI00396AA288
MTVLLLYLCGISSVLYVLSHPTVMQEFSQMYSEENYVASYLYYFLGVFSSCLVALLAGLVCGGFSCRVVYCDSLQPGVQPPTPVSPRKYRIQSGHTFHLNYIMAIANGIATFFITLWWMLFR